MNTSAPQSTGTKRNAPKWAILIGGLFLAYGLAQPLLSSRLGWNLPSPGSWLGSSESTSDRDDSQSTTRSSNSTETGSASVPSNTPPNTLSSNSESGSATESSKATSQSSAQPPLYGYLKEIDSQVYLSPAGLTYNPMGGPEKHRLNHVQRHLTDQPNRPGKHGVFSGDMPQVLRWIDETYKHCENQQPGTNVEPQGRRTVYEKSFDTAIGYVGGQVGGRQNNPEADQLRLVLEGKRVITAFPF